MGRPLSYGRAAAQEPSRKLISYYLPFFTLLVSEPGTVAGMGRELAGQGSVEVWVLLTRLRGGYSYTRSVPLMVLSRCVPREAAWLYSLWSASVFSTAVFVGNRRFICVLLSRNDEPWFHFE